MERTVPILCFAFLSVGCSSSPDYERVSYVGESEVYQGRHAAAVAPVTESGPGMSGFGDATRVLIQRGIEQWLGELDLFEGVVSLDAPNEGNEAEILIKPTLLELRRTGGRQGEVRLRVRVIEKTSRRTVLDKVYEVPCENCVDASMGGWGSDLARIALDDLQADLGALYGERPSIY